MTSVTSAPTAPRRRRRARRAAAIVILGGTLFATVGVWLASSGTLSPTINPQAGLLNSNGAIATVTSMNQSATGAGSGNSISGIAIERIRIAKSFTSTSHVAIAWLDPQDATKVLNNPNAQLQFTLYHPVAISAGANSSCSSISNAIKITDGTNTYCALADTGATGSGTVSSGSLFLSGTLLAGYLLPSVDGSGTGSTCAADTGTAWCKIPSDGDGGSDGTAQRTMWVVATIDTPGNNPKGQQAQAGTLEFYVKVSSVS